MRSRVIRIILAAILSLDMLGLGAEPGKAPFPAREAGLMVPTIPDSTARPSPTAAPGGEFVGIPAGSFSMGSPASEKGRNANESPQHQVRLSAYSIGAHEVTQAEWMAVMGSNPSHFTGDERLPVDSVCWYDGIVYCNKRSIGEGLKPCYSISGATDPDRWGSVPRQNDAVWDKVRCDFSANGYRLPTEAEWEYACRAGTMTATAFGDSLVSAQANFNGSKPYNSPGSGSYLERTSPAGSYAPNAWGLYDMHGNVLEMCWDWFAEDYYSKSPAGDPRGADSGTNRVYRGGCWNWEGTYQRSAERNNYWPYDRGSPFFFGLRLARGGLAAAGAAPDAGASAAGLVRLPAGSFSMGSPPAEKDRRDQEGPQHDVRLAAFEIGRYEVTVAEFRAFAQAAGFKTAAERNGDGSVYVGDSWVKKADASWKNPYMAQGDRDPVVLVNWFDAVEYCNWRSRQEGLKPAYGVNGKEVSWDRAANGYRLPTEAEWEYACRAGTRTATAFGDSLGSAQANFNGAVPYNGAAKGSFLKKTSPVGSYPANAWGICDMPGNAWEWCWDWYDSGYYAKSPAADPAGPAAGNDKVLRGALWMSDGYFLRSANRGSYVPTYASSGIGFRVARNAR